MDKNSLKKLKIKKIRLSASYGKRRFYYFAVCLLASLLVLAASFLDEALDTAVIALLMKLFLAVMAYSLAKQGLYLDFAEDGKLLTNYLWLALVPAVFYIALYIGPLTPRGDLVSVLLILGGALATALWEELLFRGWGRILFAEDDRCRPRDFLYTALVFGLMHLVNLFGASFGAVLIQMLEAVLMALFLQALYLRSGSLRLLVLSHFLINASAGLLAGFLSPDEAVRYLGTAQLILIGALSLYYALSAAIMIRKGKLLR